MGKTSGTSLPSHFGVFLRLTPSDSVRVIRRSSPQRRLVRGLGGGQRSDQRRLDSWWGLGGEGDLDVVQNRLNVSVRFGMARQDQPPTIEQGNPDLYHL